MLLSWLASLAGLVLGLTAAGAAALIVSPAPSMGLAFVAVAAGEKSYVIIGVALLASVLALLGSRPGLRGLSTLTVLLSLAAIGVGLVAPAQALRLASERRVDLDLGRHLTSRIDTTRPITADKTVIYATVDGQGLGLDVYPPSSGRAAAAPVVMVIHGGGWSKGTKGENLLFSRWLAERGYAVFDVEYRTSPQPNWKAAIGDVKCAIGWVRQHAGASGWNLDLTRITLLGRSAGAHLALMAAYAPGDPRLPPSCDVPEAAVESVVDLYGPTDLLWSYEHPSNPRVYDLRARVADFVGGSPETAGDLYQLLSPAMRVTPRAPRTLIIHGGRDQIVGKHNAEILADKLHDAGVRYESLFIPYAQHGFDYVFGSIAEQIVETVLLRFLNDRPAAVTAPVVE